VAGPPVASVKPGRKPEFQVFPASADVAKPIAEAPPPAKKRPDWKAATTLDPNENVSGST
jgi:hypothetical protein